MEALFIFLKHFKGKFIKLPGFGQAMIFIRIAGRMIIRPYVNFDHLLLVFLLGFGNIKIWKCLQLKK